MNVKKEEEEIVVAYLQTCKELMDQERGKVYKTKTKCSRIYAHKYRLCNMHICVCMCIQNLNPSFMVTHICTLSYFYF